MSSLENKFLFYCSGNAKSPFTNVVWTRVYEDALCSKHLWKFQGTPVHVYIIYHKIKACNIPRRTTTTAQPVAVNVLHQFLLFVQAVKARTTEAQKVRKPYCTSFSHAPHWFHCDRILFSPCLGWNTNQNYTAILIVGGIALHDHISGLLHGCLKWRFSGHQLFHLIYAVSGKEQHWRAACHFRVTKLKKCISLQNFFSYSIFSP